VDQPDDPPARPLEIEVDEQLFPDDAQTPGLVQMLESDLPALRDRMQRDTGVPLPAVTVRAQSAMAPGAYTVTVHQVPVAWGRVVPGGVFCEVETARAAGLHGDPGQDPVTGGEGLWLEGDARKEAERRNLPLANAYGFLVRHVEAVARAELPDLVGVRELQRLVEQVSVAGSRNEREQPSRRNRLARLSLLLSVVHALLLEGVPIRDLATVDTMVAAAPLDAHAGAVLRAVRAALSHDLPGRRGLGGLLRLRPDLEKALLVGVAHGDPGRLVIDRRLAGDVRRVLRADITRTWPARAILVHDATLRPFVRTLVARDLPAIPVLSDTEAFARRPPANAPMAMGGGDG
jgi:flagellar biosynthesis component FlhA